MARKRNRVSTGLSIQDIMRMDMGKFEKYSFTEQKEIVSRLASAANKRYRNFEKKEIVNPAILKMQTEGGKISVRNKNADELKKEMFRAKAFLKSKFSTQSGYKEHMKKLSESMKTAPKGIYEGMDYSLLYATAFAYYDSLQEISPNIQNVRDRYKITEKIAEYMTEGQDEKQIFENIFSWLSKEYENMQNEVNQLSVAFGNRLDEKDDTPERYKRKGF